MKTICYYHDDADGILSAALVNHFVDGEKVFVKSSYGMNIDFDIIGVCDTIYIVDFSFEPHLMDTLCVMSEKVIWIDHHASAIKAWDDYVSSMRVKYPKFPDMDGIREIGKSGCQLTEQYFYNSPNRNVTNHRINKPWKEGHNCSELVETIGTYDVWNKNNEDIPFDRAHKCMLGFIGRGLTPESEFLKECFSVEHPWSMVNELVDEGEIIKQYLDKFQNKKISKNAFETRVFGHSTIAVNTPLKGAAPLLEKFYEKNFDMMCVYFFNGKMWEYSFYTEKEDVNCAVVARSMAKDDTGIGGGHKKAAGCVLKRNLFDNTMKTASDIAIYD